MTQIPDMRTVAWLLLAGIIALSAASAQAQDAQQTAEEARSEMQRMLGTVPLWMRAYPDAGLAGAWEMTRDLEMGKDTALSSKQKELIGLAVAAQIPCDYCVYYHTQAAKAQGATEQEIREAIAMAAITRHWSTVLNGTQPDITAFRKEVDSILRHTQKAGKGKQ